MQTERGSTAGDRGVCSEVFQRPSIHPQPCYYPEPLYEEDAGPV